MRWWISKHAIVVDGLDVGVVRLKTHGRQPKSTPHPQTTKFSHMKIFSPLSLPQNLRHRQRKPRNHFFRAARVVAPADAGKAGFFVHMDFFGFRVNVPHHLHPVLKIRLHFLLDFVRLVVRRDDFDDEFRHLHPVRPRRPNLRVRQKTDVRSAVGFRIQKHIYLSGQAAHDSTLGSQSEEETVEVQPDVELGNIHCVGRFFDFAFRPFVCVPILAVEVAFLEGLPRDVGLLAIGGCSQNFPNAGLRCCGCCHV